MESTAQLELKLQSVLGNVVLSVAVSIVQEGVLPYKGVTSIRDSEQMERASAPWPHTAHNPWTLRFPKGGMGYIPRCPDLPPCRSRGEVGP